MANKTATVDDNNLTIYVDAAANPEIWSSLKRMLKEPTPGEITQPIGVAIAQ
jgi:hypothetical protein